jgi:hypothetical protein
MRPDTGLPPSTTDEPRDSLLGRLATAWQELRHPGSTGRPPATGGYPNHRLHGTLGASPTLPVLTDLSRLLKHHTGQAERVYHLRLVEETLQLAGSNFEMIPEPVFAKAALELRLLARRNPSPGVIRLLDLFERQLSNYRLRRLAAQQPPVRNATRPGA